MFYAFILGSGVPYVAIENSESFTEMILPKFQAALKEGYLQSGQRFHNLFPAEVHFLPKITF